ncbi:MAG TPA: LysR family transcriptional regulator [Steroidobacteraceae bacterium]|nr:LysR family transcriptional regulator [Steroidobacteraceae bacterium]
MQRSRPAVNFASLDLNLLRVFDAIYTTRSVTIASSTLHLTQPAVSKQLNRLREIFEDPLFVRTVEGMAPTPRAEALAGPIHRALIEVRSAFDSQVGFDPEASERTFRIFMNDAGQMALLPRLLAAVAQEAPRVNLETVQMPTARMRGVGLESGDVDLAVGYFENFDGSIHCQVLFEERYVGMVREAHPEIRETLSFEQFLHASHVIYQPAGGGHASQESFVDKAFWAAGVHRRVAVRLAHAVGMSSMVSNTDHLVVIPSRLALACARLVPVRILELPIEIPHFKVTQYWHDRFHADPGNQWLRGTFRRLYSNRDAAVPDPLLASEALDIGPAPAVNG